MIDQDDPEFFDGSIEVFFSQCIYGILHRVGRQYFRVVTDGMCRFEIALQGYVHCDLPDLMPVGKPEDLGQVDGIFAIGVAIQAGNHTSI